MIDGGLREASGGVPADLPLRGTAGRRLRSPQAGSMAVESPTTLLPLPVNENPGMSSSSEKDVEVQSFASYPLIPRPDIEIGPQLGRGAYGSVFKGTWNNGGQSIVVALKKVFMLEKEADILSKVRHRNIIQFFGVCQTNPDFFIITEFADNGCLFEYLHEKDFDLEFDQILKWAIQIANGVQYLHCEAPVTIIHRDLKSKNIVLGKKLVCKLCDFGTSKDLTHSWTNPDWAGTAAWMSPEIINQNDRITTASDVWSYAVVLWELASREIPYKGLSEFKIYTIISTLSERLVIPETCPKQLANLLRSCWKAEPDERPTMREVVMELEMMSENSELNEEVASFVNDKHQWKADIGNQLKQLDDLKLDLARKSEELDRRERALRKRENSQRNLLFSTAYNNHVASWSVESVCEWVRNISLVLESPVDPKVVEKICAIIRKYEICGFRLLEITSHDLDALGIENYEVRAELSKQINDLKMSGLGPIQYPSLQMVAEMDAGQMKEKSIQKSSFNVPIILHVGLYQRKVADRPGVPYRYKVFVDSDWKQSSYMIDDLPPEITDSSTVIQHVTLSIISKKEKVLLDSVRCVCPPFGYLEWLDASEDEVTLVCVVTYTDQVKQPRNTCIKTKISDFSKSTIEDRVVSLQIRPIATGTTITRRNSSFLVPPASPASPISPRGLGMKKTSSQNLLSLAWRNQKSSRSSASPDVVPDRKAPNIKTYPPIGKSPIWAEIAATLQKKSTEVKSSPAIANVTVQEPPVSKQLPLRSISEKHKKPMKKLTMPKPKSQRIRKHSTAGSSALRKHSVSQRKDSKASNGVSFYLDNGITDEDAETTPDSGTGASTSQEKNDVTPPESPTTKPLRRCCEKNDCRRNQMQRKPHTPNEEETVEKEILAEDGRLLRPKKNRRRGHKKKTTSDGAVEELAKDLKDTVNVASRSVYGGNRRILYSSSWKPML